MTSTKGIILERKVWQHLYTGKTRWCPNDCGKKVLADLGHTQGEYGYYCPKCNKWFKLSEIQ